MKMVAVGVLLVATGVWAAPPPCSPAVHPVKLETAYVRVCEASIAPGQSEPVHTHSKDVVLLILQGQRAQEELKSGPPQRVMTNEGDVSAIEVLKPYTHTARNAGTEDAKVLVVELLKPRSGNAGTQKPTGGAVVENSRVRVFRYVLQPGQAAPMHTHTRPYLIVSMRAMTLSMTDPQGRSFTHDVAQGDAHFQQAAVTHDVKNAGKTPSEVVEVELK